MPLSAQDHQKLNNVFDREPGLEAAMRQKYKDDSQAQGEIVLRSNMGAWEVKKGGSIRVGFWGE